MCESKQPSYVGGMKQQPTAQELLATDILVKNSSIIILPSRQRAKQLRDIALVEIHH